MQHSPMMKTLGMATWAITALASINMLTGLYGYDAFAFLIGMMPGMIMPLVWIVGLSGMISLAIFIKGFMCCSRCGACPCNCNK